MHTRTRLARRGASTGDAVLMEQAGCAAGDQASGPGANDEGVIRLCGACAVSLVSSPPGRLRDPPWGYYGPCARSSLQIRPDRRKKRGPELGECQRRSLEPQQSAERRPGGRIPPGISGDPEIGLSARTATGAALPHQRLSALCSPSFLRASGKRQKGYPEPHEKPAGGALAV